MFGGKRLRLRSLSHAWVAVAFGMGVLCCGLWLSSTQAWRAHLDRAYVTGVETYLAIDRGQTIAAVSIQPLQGTDLDHAEAGRFERLGSAPRPAIVTFLSLAPTAGDPTGTSDLKIAILSGEIQYRVAEIAADADASSASRFGAVTRLLASYCSDPVLYVGFPTAGWQQIDGQAIWGCDAAPTDLRLLAAALAVLTFAILLTQIGNTTDAFEEFSSKLRDRNIIGGPDSYETFGPKELSEIVESVNSYLEFERSQLSKRATILSGVSHDLGTPATRLRLRAALIQDPEMRRKMEADIDQMTGLIESILTFTRSELNSEEPRKLSLTSLVEAVVLDYQDTGQPVTLAPLAPVETTAKRSVFAQRAGTVALTDPARILLHARPVALRRALSNLIDNALKYGRRAVVSVTADADWAIVSIEDEGGDTSAADLERLLEPFERGDNAQSVSGFGLGLTIVATVARQHGGRVAFEDGRRGVCVKLWLRRT